MISFSSTIARIGVNPYVRPPDTVLQSVFNEAKTSRGPIPVRGEINGAPFQQSLVKYGGDWRLYVNGHMAKAAGLISGKRIEAIVGQTVSVTMGFDTAPRTYVMIPELKAALAAHPQAQAAFRLLSPGRQKEIIRYVSWLKSTEAKQRNIRKLLSVLTGKRGRYLARSWEGGR